MSRGQLSRSVGRVLYWFPPLRDPVCQ